VGQEVDASHLGSMAMLQGLSLSAKLMMDFAFPRTFRARAGNPLWNHYQCSDGKWIALGMLQGDRYWADLCRAVDLPDMATDERFVDSRARAANAEAAVAALDEVFAKKTRDEWMDHLKHAEGDFIYTIVNAVEDLPTDPQMLANDYVVDFEHPTYGTIQMLGMPVRLSETPGQVRMPAPEFGQHTEEILVDLLGYSWDRIAELREREVL
jgi:crotonobetainyl-CoA:carnitine CoA-transferase CaiB-like acyl-CoA transferase